MRCRVIRRAAPLVVVFAVTLLGGSTTRAAANDWDQLQTEAIALLSQLLRLDTTNPPGNELIAAQLLAKRFAADGIEAKVFESEPGRGNVMARLPGTGRQRPVVLLSHLDVVPADPSEWKHPPFGGVLSDGYVYGRGALDCKGLAVVEAMALVALKRSGVPLSRDVVFLATAGEETGGKLGAGWFVDNHLEELGQPEFVLNEGGGIRQRPDGTRTYEVAITEKTPLWLRLTAVGEPGHGSTPHSDSAVTKLIRALDRIDRFQPAVRVTPEVQAYYRALGKELGDGKRERYADLTAALADPDFRHEFLSRPEDAALVQNTIAPTVLHASSKTNVIPPTASAELDCRLLPDQEPDAFVRQLREVVGDDDVTFTVLLNFPPAASSADTPLYRAIEQVAAGDGVPVVPDVLRGFTDSHFFREHGITAYGFVPLVVTNDDARRVHGLDERISVENLRDGPRRLVAILRQID